jgi:hypothetical protein
MQFRQGRARRHLEEEIVTAHRILAKKKDRIHPVMV